MQAEVKDRKFYVYEHRTLDTGRIFYIGKGHGYRATVKANRNTHWKRIVAKHGYSVRFIEKNMSESDSFDLEVAAIDFCKWAGAKLTNVTDGGDGTSGLLWTEERRAKIEKSHGSESFKKIISDQSKSKWSNPEFKAKTSAAIKAATTTAEAHKLLSERSKKIWQNPEYIAKASETRKIAWQSESRKENASLKIASSWANVDIRAKRIAGIMASLSTPELRIKSAASMHTPEAKAKNRESLKNPDVIAKRLITLGLFFEKRRKWIEDNNYTGNALKVTKKMIGFK